MAYIVKLVAHVRADLMAYEMCFKCEAITEAECVVLPQGLRWDCSPILNTITHESCITERGTLSLLRWSCWSLAHSLCHLVLVVPYRQLHKLVITAGNGVTVDFLIVVIDTHSIT